MLADRETEMFDIVPPDLPLFRGTPNLQETLWGYELPLGPTKVHYQSSEYGKALYRQAWAFLRIPQVKAPVHLHTMVPETRTLFSAIKHLVDMVDIHTSKIRDTRVRQQISARLWNSLKPQLIDESGVLPDSVETHLA